MNKTDEAFFSILLALSDQQLFTGFAVLTVAYVQMNSITSYHAAVVECMATLAFVVYESASTIMYDQLRHPDKFFKMTWRAILILSFSALLLVTQLPLGNQYWLRAFGKQYKCFWRSFPGNYWSWDNAQNVFSMVIHIFCISLGISNTLANYFPRVFGWVNTNAVSSYIRFTIAKTVLLPRRLHSSSLKKLRETDVKISKIVWVVFGAISYAAAFFSFILVELFTSQALNLLNHWYLIVSSVYWGFSYRIQAPYEGREGDEDKWGFGQAVPLFLVALPLFTLLEVVYGMITPIRVSLVCARHRRTDPCDSDAFRLRRARNKTPPDSFSMQNLMTPSYATSVTEEPRPVDALVGTPSARSSGSQATVNSAVQINRPLPHQNRLDTEEGGHVSTQGQAANLDCSRQGSVCVCNQEYYWGYDVGLAEGEEMWEDKLYRRWDFKAVLLGLLLGLMVLLTIMAIYWL